MKQPAVQHARKIRELERDYASKGYRVVTEPYGSEMPEFLRSLNYRPDLIALKGEGGLVIEVTSSHDISGRSVLVTVAEAVRKQPGWEFELVLSNPRIKVEPDVPVSIEYTWVSTVLDEAQGLIHDTTDNGPRVAPLLVTWTGFESATRYALGSKSGEKQERVRASIVRQAVTMGLVSHEEGERLERLNRLRNLVAHGGRVGAEALADAAWLLTLARRVLDEAR